MTQGQDSVGPYCNKDTRGCEHTSDPLVSQCLREPGHGGRCRNWCSFCVLKHLVDAEAFTVEK